MSRSMHARRRATSLWLGLTLACGCAAEAAPASSRFPPGSVASPAGPIVIEVGSAHYRERGVTLSFSVHNHTKAEVVVLREGILLARDDLEFAVQSGVEGAPSETSAVGPDGTASFEVSFDTGHALHEPARLLLRAVKSGDAWLDPTSVEIPPMPVKVER